MTEFFTKYPDADLSRFVFKNEKVWFKINPDNENRLLDIESDTYQRTPTWTKYLTSYKERGFGLRMVPSQSFRTRDFPTTLPDKGGGNIQLLIVLFKNQ